MSLTERFVSKNTCLGIRTVNESTGEGFTELLMKALRENNIKDSPGQGCDNGDIRKVSLQDYAGRSDELHSYPVAVTHSLNLVI